MTKVSPTVNILNKLCGRRERPTQNALTRVQEVAVALDSAPHATSAYQF